jgi:protein O-GlcNAc transferase
VPVVTVAGTTHASRVGVSLLSTIGVPELIARDEHHYVALASELVRDAARLAQYRATLRERMAASALLDGPAFAKRFENALIDGFEAANAAAGKT